MKNLTYLTIALLGATALMSAANAQQTVTTVTTTQHVAPAVVDITAVPHNTYLVLSGVVRQLGERGNFVLDHGNGSININTAGWDWSALEDNHGLKPGDNVTVSGVVRDNEYTGRQFMAETVQLHNQYTYFFEDGKEALPTNAPDIDSAAGVTEGMYVSITGTIISHNPKKAEFVLRTKTSDITIDISDIDRKPFDNQGNLQLKDGDHVRVYGEVDDDFLEDHEFEADRIIILRSMM